MIPSGRQLKQNLPKKVINVFKRADSLPSLICQQEFASSFENPLAPPNWARVCSTEGRMSLPEEVLIQPLSTQMRTLPFSFGMSTTPAHQSVGSSTGEIKLICSILSSSAFTFWSSGRAILRCGEGKWLWVFLQSDVVLSKCSQALVNVGILADLFFFVIDC